MKRGVAQVELEVAAELGEGALWDRRVQRLWWVDISRSRLHRYDPSSGLDERFDTGSPVGAVVPEEGADVALALEGGFASFDVGSGKIAMLARVTHADATIRFNDGKCDPAGRFWAGTMARDGRAGAGNLFCLERDLSIACKRPGVSTSNGLGWSPDAEKMYYIDTPTQCVLELRYDAATGAIHSPRIAIRIARSEGAPDGLCVDAHGMLWIALWGAGKVVRFDPWLGKRLEEIVTPGAMLTTSCALGGPDLQTLFVTTAREHLGRAELRKQPRAGHLFSARVGVRGLPANSFRRDWNSA